MAKPNRSNMRSAHQSPPPKKWPGRLVAFALGYLFASSFDFSAIQKALDVHLIQPYFKKHMPAVLTQKPLPPPKPKLEFYTLLTKPEAKSTETINLPTAVATKPVSSSSEAPSTAQYTVQLASFQDRKDAESMKASLLLKGLSVSITTFEKNQMQWYRVNLGPFSSRHAAEEAQQSVAKQEHISGMVRKASA